LQAIVEHVARRARHLIFNLPVLNALIQLASPLERPYRFAVSLVLVSVDCLGRPFLTEPQRLAKEALCANDDETKTCREFTLEILWGVRRG
jgi:hypothetical protein